MVHRSEGLPPTQGGDNSHKGKSSKTIAKSLQKSKADVAKVTHSPVAGMKGGPTSLDLIGANGANMRRNFTSKHKFSIRDGSTKQDKKIGRLFDKQDFSPLSH